MKTNYLFLICLMFLFFGCSCNSDDSKNNIKNENTSYQNSSDCTETQISIDSEDFNNTKNENTSYQNSSDYTEILISINADDIYSTEENTLDLSALSNYVIKLYNQDLIPNYKFNDEIVGEIYLFQNNNADVLDALIEIFNGDGYSYFIIQNIDSPQLINDFSAFNTAELFYDVKTEDIVIKYLCNYGRISNATSETDYVFIGNDGVKSQIKHVHYTGTERENEFYIETDGQKFLCNENDIKLSTEKIEQDLQPFTDFKTYKLRISDSNV